MKKFLVFLLSCFSINVAIAEDLQNTVKEALANHPEVNAAINSRYSSEQELRAAQGGYLPSLNLNAEAGRKNVDDATTRAAGRNNGLTQSPNEATLSLEQNVFNVFATNSEVARQKATVDSRAYGVMNTSESTAYAVIQAYFDVLSAQDSLNVAMAQKNAINSQLEMAKRNFEVGTA
ncbi:MAG: TolC family protein, partial [Hafnia sp.]